MKRSSRPAPRPRVRVQYDVTRGDPAQRGLACINIGRDDKQVFDAGQAWASIVKGRPVHQWEAFSMLLAAALENEDSEFARALAFLPSG